MSNVIECWSLLETLEYPVIGGPPSDKLESERIQENKVKLQKCVQLLPSEVARCLIDDLDLDNLRNKYEDIANNTDDECLYSIYSLLVLRKICKDDFQSAPKDQLVSERHRSIVFACIEDVVQYGLKLNLHPSFYERKGSIFSRKSKNDYNFYRTEWIVEVFSSIIHVDQLNMERRSEEILLCYMAAILSLQLASESEEYLLDKTRCVALQSKLQRIWTEISKSTYYRNIMLLYGILPPEKQHRIHREMLLKLWSSGGFVALLSALQKSERNEEQAAEVVVKLVTNPSYSVRAQQSLVKQILRYLMDVCNKDMVLHMGAGLQSLRKLFENNSENKDLVKDWLKQQLQPLTDIYEDRLTVMEWEDFTSMICLLFQMFCTSSFDCLPSELIVCYFPVLISCYQQIRFYGHQEVVCSHLRQLILKILNNRGKEELKNIIKCTARNSYPTDWLQKHPNIVFEESILSAEDLRIVQKETAFENNMSYVNSLSKILIESSFHTLSYNVFIIFFRLIPTLELEDTSLLDGAINTGLFISAEDTQIRVLKDISERYNGKIQVFDALHTLIQHKPLKYLVNENISDILNILQEILATYTTTSGMENSKQLNESVIMILLVLIKEIMRSKFENIDVAKTMLLKSLKQLERKVQDKSVKYQISALQNQIENKYGVDDAFNSSKDRFEEARSLIESNEPYRQVEGIEQLIKLIKEKDAFTINSVHVVIALAMDTLKTTESYTFLNCVRLFASLVNIHKHQVLELLTDDYLNESASTDYRLLVGEALLRVCKEIGPLCYKYKGLLLNTYMFGCRSNLDEFRFSSFSNLGHICKLLTFEVHNYFEELLNLINCELTTGKYIPAKRAAVMVLSDILLGMNNLFDYEEMLLPIYRLLKFLVFSNYDEKIRLHASIGLDSISEKCKDLLLAVNQQPMEKCIKITGIKNNSKQNQKNFILNMN